MTKMQLLLVPCATKRSGVKKFVEHLH